MNYHHRYSSSAGGGGTESLAVSRILLDVERVADDIRSSQRSRIQAVEIAEKLLIRREQLVAARELAIPRAITLCSGSLRDLEAAANIAVADAAALLPSPVSVAGFVRELEDRAVDLECSLHLVKEQLCELRRSEAACQAKETNAQVMLERARLLDHSAREMLAELRKRELRHHQAHPNNNHDGVGAPMISVLTQTEPTDPVRVPTTTNDEHIAERERIAGREERLAVALRQHELEVGCFRQQQQWFLLRMRALEEIEGRLRSFGLLE